MSKQNTSQEKEILVVLRGILRIQRNTNERVEGMFFLITGKNSYYHHAMHFYVEKNSRAPGLPSLEKTDLFSFLDRVLEDPESLERDMENPFLRNLRTNLEYVLTRFFTPRDIDNASSNLEGGRKATALNLANYLENNYGVETTVDVLFERKEKEALRKYLGNYTPSSQEKTEETKASPAPGNVQSLQVPRQEAPLSCSLLIDPIQGVTISSLEKGWRLAIAFPENGSSLSPEGKHLPGSPANPLPGTVTAVYPLEDGGYVVQLLLEGDSPSLCEASLDGNYRVRIWQNAASENSLHKEFKEPEEKVPQSERALFYIALTIGVAAILGLGYYFFLTP